MVVHDSKPTLQSHLALLVVSLILALAAGMRCALAQPRMPEVAAESLAAVAVTLPRDLPAPKTLVLLGFEFDHQAVMDTWVQKMALKRPNQDYAQLHLIGRAFGLISGFINSRKRPYFSDEQQRQRVIPVYTDVSAFITAMGFADSKTKVLLAVVGRDGAVLARAEGAFDADKAKALMAAMDE
jgi:hypothetical protein